MCIAHCPLHIINNLLACMGVRKKVPLIETNIKMEHVNQYVMKFSLI